MISLPRTLRSPLKMECANSGELGRGVKGSLEKDGARAEQDSYRREKGDSGLVEFASQVGGNGKKRRGEEPLDPGILNNPHLD